MEGADNGSAYPPSNRIPDATTFVEAPQDFSPFNSPPHSHKPQAAAKKRKKTIDHEQDATSHGGFNVLDLNSPVQSNPDIDAFIRSRRKPREKKSCQICRKRKVGCDQQQPCQNCIGELSMSSGLIRAGGRWLVMILTNTERRYPELCVYSNETAHSSRAENPASHGQEQSRQQPNVTNVFEENRGPSGETVTVPKEYFDRLLAKLDHFQSSSAALNTEIRTLISQSSNHAPSSENGSSHSMHTLQTVSRLRMEEEQGLFVNEGIHTRNELTGQTVHVGGNSMPAFVMTYGNHLEDLLGSSILPAFGLENESATYPFVGLSDLKQGRLSRLVDLCKTLPPESEINRIFTCFRDISAVVYPAMADIDKFEGELLQFHIARAEANTRSGETNGVDEQGAWGKNIAWVGLLFAALASGCQCTDYSAKELDLTSRVFVCCSFECLRLTNFLSNPSLENIQTLLILGNVISNTMNAGVAWALLGMTNRLAQVLGLHKAFGLEMVQDRRKPRDANETVARMGKFEQELRQIMGNAAAHLKSSALCTSFREQLQHWALYLHTSYIMSEVCREALKPKIIQTPLAKAMKQTCLDSLTNTVRAFLGLNRLTSFASHSWAALSRALSSALVLGVLGEAESKEEVRDLLSQLRICLQDIVAKNSDGAEISAPIKRWISSLHKLTSGADSRGGSSAGTSPVLGLDSDDSPYARVEDIIWGPFS
ncbi:hypothetical protein BLS_003891 [Venturia inaequalis]|uniref:Zn(2)-C6 fungal-type domain-containing protein n=1 Tax=Venturia inaequalis TaxID=5025 RepID=A0A8H3UME8_VENIN|nr:hypothetical protein BLS_003891 [Venturia inaequalis]